PTSAQPSSEQAYGAPVLLPPFANNSHDLRHPLALAVDAAGDVYVTDKDVNRDVKHRVAKLAAGSMAATEGLAVDAAGTLYLSDNDNDRVLKLAAGSTTQTVLPFTGLRRPCGVA